MDHRDALRAGATRRGSRSRESTASQDTVLLHGSEEGTPIRSPHHTGEMSGEEKKITAGEQGSIASSDSPDVGAKDALDESGPARPSVNQDEFTTESPTVQSVVVPRKGTRQIYEEHDDVHGAKHAEHGGGSEA